MMHFFSWVNPNTFTQLLMGLWIEGVASVLVPGSRMFQNILFLLTLKKMPYVSSRIHSAPLCSCIFYAPNSAIWVTNAVNFHQFEEPVIHLGHDSSVHLMWGRHKNSQLLFYKCVLAQRLHSLKYLCFRSYWAARRPLSVSQFSFLSLSPLFSTFFFSNSAKHNSQHSACVPVFSHSKQRQGKNKMKQ